MTKIILVLGITLVGFNAKSQIINDSISMETSYTKQIFYSLANGEVASVDNNNWNIGVATYGQGAAGSAIMLNEATTSLWAYPGDTTDWNTFDTTSFAGWERLLNSDTTWTNGAFNKYRDGFDMGWGVLNPTNNYWTFGDSLYLMKLSDGTFRKLWIVSLKTGVWSFKYANLDGANEQLITINKTDYPNKNFVYHSMVTATTIDREPDNSTWDILFMKHLDYLNPPGMYQGVTSVFSNSNVQSAKANEVDYATASISTTPQTAFTKKIDNIGREWKRFKSGTGWVVRDSIAYFVYDNAGNNFYRLVFTGFGGTANGTAFFEKEKMINTSIEALQGTANFSMYPNPTNGNVTLLLAYFSNDAVTISITDLSGKVVYQVNEQLMEGLNRKNIILNYLSKGIYLLSVKNDKFQLTQKLVMD